MTASSPPRGGRGSNQYATKGTATQTSRKSGRNIARSVEAVAPTPLTEAERTDLTHDEVGALITFAKGDPRHLEQIRVRLYQNPATQPVDRELLIGLSPAVRKRATRTDQDTSPRELRRVWAADQSGDMQRRMSRHPNCPPEILEVIHSHLPGSRSTKDLVIAHPDCPRNVLRAAAESPHTTLPTMKAVAAHANTPVDVLERLAVSGSPDVSKVAMENPALPAALKVAAVFTR